MEKHVKGLLSALRQAVNEAILGSHDVNAALAAIGRTGRCPSLSVDVALENPSWDDPAGQDQSFREDQSPYYHGRPYADEPGRIQSMQPGELILTGSDEVFLEALGISVDASAEIASKTPLK